MTIGVFAPSPQSRDWVGLRHAFNEKVRSMKRDPANIWLSSHGQLGKLHLSSGYISSSMISESDIDTAYLHHCVKITVLSAFEFLSSLFI